MGPCHLYFVIADSAGNQSRSAKVRVTYPGSPTLVAETLYLDQEMTHAAPSEFTCEGIINLWTETPMRVDVAVTSYDVGSMFLPGMDFLVPPEATVHGHQRTRLHADLATPGTTFTIASEGQGYFQAVDVVSGHFHSGRSDRSVAIVPIGLEGGDPLARVTSIDHTVLPGVGVKMDTISVRPGAMPSSVNLVKRPVFTQSLWGYDGPATIVENNEDLSTVQVYDPSGIGRSVLIATDSDAAVGNRMVMIGSDIHLGWLADQKIYNPWFGLPTTEYVGEEVVIGRSVYYEPRSVQVVGGDGLSGSNVGHYGVALGSGFSWYPVNYWRDNVSLGNGYASYTGYGSFNGAQGHDTILGHPGSGIYDDYARPWGITTILAADAGFPQDGSHLTPTGPVDTARHIRNNDSWIYSERYFEWIRLGLDVDQAAWAAAPITRNTIIPRAAIPATGLAYERADWYGWNIAAQNVFSRVQPIADRDDYYNGLILITRVDPWVPGSIEIDDGVTLGAPLHDGIGGTPSSIGFYGHAVAARTVVTDNASIPALTSLISALAQLGLILTPGVPVVQDDFTKPKFTVGPALTGQTPVGFPMDRSNLGTSGGLLVRNPFGGTDDGHWVAALYYTDIFDVLVTATVGAWGSADDGVIIRAIPDNATFQSSRGQNLNYGLLAGKTDLYLRDASGGKTSLGAYSSAMANGDVMTVQAIARAVTIKKNGSTVLTFTLPDDLGGRMHGLALTTGTTFSDLSIAHP